jgi:large subunit ribosomal protein L9
MEVILLNDVPNLGKIGELLKVKPGYARNFLFPRGFAAMASVNNKKRLEHEKRVANDRSAKLRADSEALAQRIQALVVTIARKVGEQDKLFGSVSVRDIHEGLVAALGLSIDRHDIQLADPIRALGTYEVAVRLTGGIQAQLKVAVVAE